MAPHATGGTGGNATSGTAGNGTNGDVFAVDNTQLPGEQTGTGTNGADSP